MLCVLSWTAEWNWDNPAPLWICCWQIRIDYAENKPKSFCTVLLASSKRRHRNNCPGTSLANRGHFRFSLNGIFVSLLFKCLIFFTSKSVIDLLQFYLYPAAFHHLTLAKLLFTTFFWNTSQQLNRRRRRRRKLVQCLQVSATVKRDFT